MTKWFHMNFPSPTTIISEEMSILHDIMLISSTSIITLVTYFLSTTLLSMKNNSFKTDHKLESAWTSLPMLMLILMALPSLKLLYFIDESSPQLTVKINAHQWYWTYEYPEMNNEKDSYMAHSKISRLIYSTSPMAVPSKIMSRMLVSSEDVIHSWAMPAMASSVDALPGRVNLLTITPLRSGVFFGQCSEICGTNHSFMPSIMEVLPLSALNDKL